MNTLVLVNQFMKCFKKKIHPKPYLLDDELNALCISLIEEEFEELIGAIKERNVIETLDALTDLQYVLDFAYLSLGFHKIKDKAFLEVHRSNMSKLGDDGQPILREEDGKVMKGPNYSKPDLLKIIRLVS